MTYLYPFCRRYHECLLGIVAALGKRSGCFGRRQLKHQVYSQSCVLFLSEVYLQGLERWFSRETDAVLQTTIQIKSTTKLLIANGGDPYSDCLSYMPLELLKKANPQIFNSSTILFFCLFFFTPFLFLYNSPLSNVCTLLLYLFSIRCTTRQPALQSYVASAINIACIWLDFAYGAQVWTINIMYSIWWQYYGAAHARGLRGRVPLPLTHTFRDTCLDPCGLQCMPSTTLTSVFWKIC